MSTYYVGPAPTGNGSGSDASNLMAWSSVASQTASGDTIYLRGMNATIADSTVDWPAGRIYYANSCHKYDAITWTLNIDYRVGRFCNGDLWVVGPVTITGFSPASTDVGGRVKNGAMINPEPGFTAQGYDSAMPDNTYTAGLNVAYNVSAGSPLVVPTGSSLVSSVSLATVGGKTTLQWAAILTVLATAPAEGAFRPAYCGTDKTVRFNASQLNYSYLQTLTAPASAPSLTTAEGYFKAPWIDHRAGWSGEQMHPEANMPYYGRDIQTRIGEGALMLHLNYTYTQKKLLLCRFVQLGIDFYGIIAAGSLINWQADGGVSGGRKWPILFAGIILNDATMQAVGAKSGDYLYEGGYGPGNEPPDYIRFGEDDQTFYVAQLDVDATHDPAWNPDYRDTTQTPYEVSDIGLAEWGIRHAEDPYQSNKWLPTIYRGVAGSAFNGTALAALLTYGAQDLWNHDAFFDYTARYMQVTDAGGDYEGWWRSWSSFNEDMWDTYSGTVISPPDDPNPWPEPWPDDPDPDPIYYLLFDEDAIMPVAYTSEMKLPLNDDGGYNWGAVINGILELLDKGHEITLTFGETVAAGDCIALKASDGKAYKAKGDDTTLTPAIGFAPSAVTNGDQGKVRDFGWIDVMTSYSFSPGQWVYPHSTAGIVAATRVSFSNPVAWCKTATTAENVTRFMIQPGRRRKEYVYEAVYERQAVWRTEIDNGNLGTSKTIDWRVGNKQCGTVTDDCDLSFTAPDGPCNVVFKLVGDAVGGHQMSWPAAINWPNDEAPAVSVTPERTDLLCAYWDGTNYWGSLATSYV